MKDASSWQPDADQTLAGASQRYKESSLFLSYIPFNKFLFTISHPCIRSYFGRLGLLIVRDDLKPNC